MLNTHRIIFHLISHPNLLSFSAILHLNLIATSAGSSSSNLEPLEQLSVILQKSTDEILGGLPGYDAARIEDLRAARVV